MDGHYWQWIDACIAGYGKNELSSPFEGYMTLTETVLMGNLILRSFNIRQKVKETILFMIWRLLPFLEDI
jgi:hypothetical protein